MAFMVNPRRLRVFFIWGDFEFLPLRYPPALTPRLLFWYVL